MTFPRRRFLQLATGFTCLPVASSIAAAQPHLDDRGEPRPAPGPARLPMLKGPMPFAVVLCRFNDVPEPDIPRSRFLDFVARSGTGGLLDYWGDISYGLIDLTGSQVFGWYTMKYSFVRDGTKGRHAWIDEAIRLAAENRVNLRRFHAVIAVVNGGVDDSNGGRHTALAIGGYWGQANWRWCKKCQGLGYGGAAAPGACPAGGTHGFGASASYSLSINDPHFRGEPNWRGCAKCNGLVYSGGQVRGACPAGGVHDQTGSAEYRLTTQRLGYPGQDKWMRCRKCEGLVYTGRAAAKCAGGGDHDITGSANYVLVINGSAMQGTFQAHETGHCLGLAHSWSANPDVEYGDPWDIMSAARVKSFDNHAFGAAGPGLNAPTLYKLGWLPQERVVTFTTTAGQSAASRQIVLTPLNRPSAAGYLMARILSPNHAYTVEFRQPTDWDGGIRRKGVLIHELRSNYTMGQPYWAHCAKCRGLFYAGTSPCPAGGMHDDSTSANYRLAMNDASFPGQAGWRWCRKCQGLALSGASPGRCPAGGAHDYSRSANYTLAVDNRAFVGQNLWRHCRKCEGLFYAGYGGVNACPAGGRHDETGSGDYGLAKDTGGKGQDRWRWCSKCQGLAYNGFSVCAAGGSHMLTSNHDYSWDYSVEMNNPNFPGQDRWKFCHKCFGLAYSGFGDGRCAAGGGHDVSGPVNYSLLHDAGDANGQNHWRRCRKCELLAYWNDEKPGPCPAGGSHDHGGSFNYTVAHFPGDRTFLIKADWQPGQKFEDAARYVRIAIDKFDESSSTALVTIG
jgi:hypothetical protein